MLVWILILEINLKSLDDYQAINFVNIEILIKNIKKCHQEKFSLGYYQKSPSKKSVSILT
ncbi:hypothetical protein CK510_30230 [Brunnivagina elsteri CCALA 953]|uniref:Uncharacterized protein n=1 Tax=Brunnivagina elsteri CCALA 953 TaxID=987040 RepID=A0A2A2TAJ5_9CYAN|nr:hypothetical protein CK510_30230 [Calothrix elsteri CCALA 953]